MNSLSVQQPTLEHELARAGVARAELDEVITQVRLRLQSRQSVGNAISKLPMVPAGFTRAVQATENAWHRIDDEFGMLQSVEVAKLIGSSSPHRNIASDMRKRGQIVGVERLNRYLYPGFQFGADGAVKPAIKDLLTAAEAAGWTDASLVLWLCAPSGAFAGSRPVDHLDDDNMVQIAVSVMVTDW